jgi:hypothetical protein
LRVNIITASWKKDALDGGEQARNAILAFVERNEDGGGSGGLKRGEIGRERALVVFSVGGGGFGYGDAYGHGRGSVNPGGNLATGLDNEMRITDGGWRRPPVGFRLHWR